MLGNGCNLKGPRQMIVATGKLHSRERTMEFVDNRGTKKVTYSTSFQPIVWCSFVRSELGAKRRECPENSARVPVVLDTGCSLGLLANYWHLSNWFNIKPAKLVNSRKKTSFVHGQPVHFYEHISVWLHRSSQSPEKNAFRISLDKGVGLGDFSNPIISLRRRRSIKSLVTSFLRLEKIHASMEADDVEAFYKANSNRRSDIPSYIYPRLPLLGVPSLVQNKLTLNLTPTEFSVNS